jgi:hypothetical protein
MLEWMECRLRHAAERTQRESQVKSALECQARCAAIQGCAHFTYWPDGGCHLQDPRRACRSQKLWNCVSKMELIEELESLKFDTLMRVLVPSFEVVLLTGDGSQDMNCAPSLQQTARKQLLLCVFALMCVLVDTV